MEQIYGKSGNSFQQVGGDCPDGFIEMSESRPSPNHIARADGTWTLPDVGANRLAEIDARIAQIDTETIRPMRAVLAKTDTLDDLQKLQDLEVEVQDLREERASLTADNVIHEEK
jgi:alpha-L-fucosidase